MNIRDQQLKYEKWWLNKFVESRSDTVKKVVKITLVGPPSFVYGDVWLTFLDGSEEAVIHRSYRPTKKDLTVVPQMEKEAV